MKILRDAIVSSSAGNKRIAKNRRALLTAVLAGAMGIISYPAWADGGSRKKGTTSRRSTVASSGSDRKGGMTDGVMRAFQDLKKIGPDRQVRTIEYVDGTYRVTTVDGQRTDFLGADLRFGVDSSAAGPFRSKPVILSTGMKGDRGSVFFASPKEISAFINYQT